MALISITRKPEKIGTFYYMKFKFWAKTNPLKFKDKDEKVFADTFTKCKRLIS